MKNFILLITTFLFGLVVNAQTSNVGIGDNSPGSKLAVNGNFAVGNGYSGSAAPTDGAIIKGQVGIGTSSPNATAVLDVTSTNQGMAIPRLALVTTTNPIAGTKPAGLIVYNTSTSGTYAVPGIYMWDGSDWVRVIVNTTLFPNIQPLSASGGGGLNFSPGSYNGSAATTVGIATGGIVNSMIANTSIDLTTKVTNQLPVSNGGTGVNTVTGVIIGSGTSPFTGVAASGPSQYFRRNAANTAYEFAALTSTDVPSGSANYIWNQSVNGVFGTGQAASFDITANGEIGGTLNVNGNVGIGTPSPSAKLDVFGNIDMNGRAALTDFGDGWLRFNQSSNYANGTYSPGFLRVDGGIASGGVGSLGGGTVNATGVIRGNGYQDANGNQVIDAGGGWHRSYGNTGWYNGTYAGGWYMTDVNWIRSYNSKDVYIDRFLRADNGITSGPAGSPGAGYFRATALAGTGNRAVYADANGTLVTGYSGDASGNTIVNGYSAAGAVWQYVYFNSGLTYVNSSQRQINMTNTGSVLVTANITVSAGDGSNDITYAQGFNYNASDWGNGTSSFRVELRRYTPSVGAWVTVNSSSAMCGIQIPDYYLLAGGYGGANHAGIYGNRYSFPANVSLQWVDPVPVTGIYYYSLWIQPMGRNQNGGYYSIWDWNLSTVPLYR